MQNIYRFSPITSEETYRNALTYIVTQLEKMSLHFFEEKLPINTVKIFAHYDEEYVYLSNIVQNLGQPAPFNSDTSYYAMVDTTIAGYAIEYIGVRVVDPYRLHVGCGDFEIPNFRDFEKAHANKQKFVRPIREDMIEVWHPDYDVLGYVVPPFQSSGGGGGI